MVKIMKTLLFNLKFWLHLLANPAFFIRNHPYDARTDEIVRDLMNNGTTFSLNEYTLKIDGVAIWTSNYPYAFGRINGIPALPSRKTAYLLKNLIDKMEKEQENKKRSNTYHEIRVKIMNTRNSKGEVNGI